MFIVANSAAISGWLLNVEGGGWEHYTCGPFPAVVRGAMAGFCVMEDDDFGTTPSLDFKITTADEAAEVGFQAEAIYSLIRRGPAHQRAEARFPFVQPFELGIIASRAMRASVAVGGVELAAVAFYVRDQPPQKAIRSSMPLTGMHVSVTLSASDLIPHQRRSTAALAGHAWQSSLAVMRSLDKTCGGVAVNADVTHGLRRRSYGFQGDDRHAQCRLSLVPGHP